MESRPLSPRKFISASGCILLLSLNCFEKVLSVEEGSESLSLGHPQMGLVLHQLGLEVQEVEELSLQVMVKQVVSLGDGALMISLCLIPW